jgi:hypothetical protein
LGLVQIRQMLQTASLGTILLLAGCDRSPSCRSRHSALFCACSRSGGSDYERLPAAETETLLAQVQSAGAVGACGRGAGFDDWRIPPGRHGSADDPGEAFPRRTTHTVGDEQAFFDHRRGPLECGGKSTPGDHVRSIVEDRRSRCGRRLARRWASAGRGSRRFGPRGPPCCAARLILQTAFAPARRRLAPQPLAFAIPHPLQGVTAGRAAVPSQRAGLLAPSL